FLAGLSAKTNRAWIQVGQARVRADLRIEGSDKPSLSVYFDEKNSPKGQHALACQTLADEMENPQGLQVNFNVALRYDHRKSTVALLRIGYLMMFRQFGYAYVLNPNLDQIREQLLSPEKEIISAPVAVDIPEEPAHLNTVAIVTSPAAHKAFF